MFGLAGIDAGTCSDVFLPQCRCTEHTGHGELIEGDASKEIACPTHPSPTPLIPSTVSRHKENTFSDEPVSRYVIPRKKKMLLLLI